jgi:hypothetical protein
MNRLKFLAPNNHFFRPDRANNGILSYFLIVSLTLLTVAGHAGTTDSTINDEISVEAFTYDADRGYGYKLQYYVAAPLDIFWRFKTDFAGDFVLSNEELLEHRLVRTEGNSAVTENRYAAAPSLRFLWQTTVVPEQYRLEFELLNAEDCHHDFHYGTIQLSPAGEHTKVTQIAFFNFTGASLWVKYPWYGGMKSLLTKVARWERNSAMRLKRDYAIAMNE